jgi:hypothetical protein
LLAASVTAAAPRVARKLRRSCELGMRAPSV